MKPLNLIVLGTFPFPEGMAGTKLMRAVIKGLRDDPGISIRVVVLRQSSRENPLSGVHEGIPYETVLADLTRARMALWLPLLQIKTTRLLRRLVRSDCQNVILKYGPPDLDSVMALRYARRLGFKIVFFVVEDYDLALGLSRSLAHRVKMVAITALTRRMKGLASGIVVITLHLLDKYKRLTREEVPVHYRPVAVDLTRFSGMGRPFGNSVTLFYSGSFGKKDGLPVLLNAFNQLAGRRANVRLVLTGRGSAEDTRATLAGIEASPYKSRIDYQGYLDEDGYLAALSAADIACMTRVDTGFANAGFPYKLAEYLATGKPVIASRVSDVERLLEDGRTAMLVKPGDSDAIVAAVDYLLANPGEAAAMGERGRAKARELFDCLTQGKALAAFLRSV